MSRTMSRTHSSPLAEAFSRLLMALGVVVVALLLMGSLTGCRMTVETERAEGKQEPKNVEIETPFGSLRVRTHEVDPRDIGLSVYPGARRKPSRKDETESANVQISSGAFALKVVAIAYESDDPSDKVLDFYRKEMKAMGEVVECRGDLDLNTDRHDEDKEIRCKPGGDHDKIELGVRAGGGYRIVHIQPKGQGTEFNLIFISTRGKGETI